jgi:hypothetical protein
MSLLLSIVLVSFLALVAVAVARMRDLFGAAMLTASRACATCSVPPC